MQKQRRKPQKEARCKKKIDERKKARGKKQEARERKLNNIFVLKFK